MDDKYNGCNVVESVVTSKPERSATKRKKPRGTGLVLRLVISAAIIGILLVLHYFTQPQWLNGAAEILRKVFLYDLFGNTEFGLTPIYFG